MPSEVECAEALSKVRWASGLQRVCCGGRSVVRRGWRKGLYRRYYCKDCGRWFNDRTGMVFANSKLPFRVWFFTAFMMQSKVSVRELAEDLKLPYSIMHVVVGKLRLNLYLTASTVKLQRVVELDEVYVTARLKGKRDLRRKSRILDTPNQRFKASR